MNKKETKYELLNPVFQVVNALDWNDRKTLCVVPYIRLHEPASRGYAITILAEELRKKYQTQEVNFMFWTDGVTSGLGSPQDIDLPINLR